jgi:hypothetical protein
MFRHLNTILMESTETKELKSNTPVQVLIDIIGIVKAYFDILKYILIY